jgi:putative tricarboxylic transport membrane protein
MPRSLKDLLAGLVFVAFGLVFAVVATSYEIGSALRMGPGYFPFVLGCLLVLLGGLIAVRGLLAGEGEAIGAIPWQAVGLIIAAVLFFGLTVRGLGLVPSVFVTALMSGFASRRITLVMGLLVTVGLTILCILVFVVALRLRLPLLGPWIPV